MKRLAAIALLLLLLGIPLGICVAFACDQLSSRDDLPEWLPVAAVLDLECDGVPRRKVAWSEHYDAWTRGAPQPAGGVFVRCDGEQRGLTVLSSLGHAGCIIEYDVLRCRFTSPCYTFEYDADGRMIDRPAPDLADIAPVAFRIDEGWLFVRRADLRYRWVPRRA